MVSGLAQCLHVYIKKKISSHFAHPLPRLIACMHLLMAVPFFASDAPVVEIFFLRRLCLHGFYIYTLRLCMYVFWRYVGMRWNLHSYIDQWFVVVDWIFAMEEELSEKLSEFERLSEFEIYVQISLSFWVKKLCAYGCIGQSSSNPIELN